MSKFLSTVEVPTPTAAMHPATKAYVDANAGGSNPTVNTIAWSGGGTINYSNKVFALNVNGSGTLAESNLPTNGTLYEFQIDFTLTSGTFTKPSSWSQGMAIPTAAGNYILYGRTTNGGSSFYITVGYL